MHKLFFFSLEFSSILKESLVHSVVPQNPGLKVLDLFMK